MTHQQVVEQNSHNDHKYEVDGIRGNWKAYNAVFFIELPLIITFTSK